MGPEVVFFGGGGHAAVCLDVFRSSGRSVLGYLGPEATALGVPHLGPDDSLATFDPGEVEVFIAVGSNRGRQKLAAQAMSAGFRLATCVHASAVVSPSAVIGAGSVLMPGAIVNARTRLGIAVIVNTGASIDHDGVVGDLVHVAPGTHVAGSVRIGSGAFLGVGVSVIPEIEIGQWSVIGAGAAVVNDIPADVVAVGVPARPRM
jgi:UDP-perosamine 4-acetyltransferase